MNRFLLLCSFRLLRSTFLRRFHTIFTLLSALRGRFPRRFLREFLLSLRSTISTVSTVSTVSTDCICHMRDIGDIRSIRYNRDSRDSRDSRNIRDIRDIRDTGSIDRGLCRLGPVPRGSRGLGRVRHGGGLLDARHAVRVERGVERGDHARGDFAPFLAVGGHDPHVAALLVSIAQLLRYILAFNSRRRD